MIGLLAVGVFVILLTTWLLQYFKYEKHLKKFKGPRAWPLVGAAFEFGTTVGK